MAQFASFLRARAILRLNSTGMNIKTFHCYCKKKIDNNFPWSLLLSALEMRSKRPKLCSETTPLRLVVPLEFWTLLTSFLRSIRVQTMRNCCRFVIKKKKKNSLRWTNLEDVCGYQYNWVLILVHALAKCSSLLSAQTSGNKLNVA